MSLYPRDIEALLLTAELGSVKLAAERMGIGFSTTQTYLRNVRDHYSAISTMQALWRHFRLDERDSG